MGFLDSVTNFFSSAGDIITELIILILVIIYAIGFFAVQYYLIKAYIWIFKFIKNNFPMVKDFLVTKFS
jgi:hypothetical protein